MKAEDIRPKAQGRWGGILATLAPDLVPALIKTGRHVACPIHGGHDGFRVYKDVDETGGSICNTCGAHSDGFSTLMWVNGWDFRTALQAVSDYLGGGNVYATATPRACQPAPKVQQKDNESVRQALNKVWTSSISMSHKDAEPGRLYLARRGISVSAPETLRFHRALKYVEDDKVVGAYPAILAMVSDIDGNPVTIHRTYLMPHGVKAPVASPKKIMSYPDSRTMTGGAIRLTSDSHPRVMAIAEGLETSLAVFEAIGIPTWCAVNAHLMENFVPPKGLETLVIFADKDKPSPIHPNGHGQEAAVRLVKRVWDMGIKATVFVPPMEISNGEKSIDWLDVLVRHGRKHFPPISYIERIKRQSAA